MSLQAAFKQFLAAPNTSLLSEDASLHYITTLVTQNGPAEIIKHLNSQSHQLKKKEEKFLDVVEGEHALAVESETTIEFLTGGGAYLPGLDDNFLADRTVTFPIIHIVSFDSNGKITQMRQNWDQGSLLKLIDVIGKTGRNWPIRDGKDQAKLIANSVKSAGKPTATSGARPPPRQERQDDGVSRSRENSTNVTRDPHASLSLFAPRDHSEQAPEKKTPLPYAVASHKPPPRDYSELFVGGEPDAPTPRPYAVASHKPPPRDLSELFVGGDPDPPTPSARKNNALRDRSASPPKFSAGVAPKGGAGRNYQPSRLFDMDENEPEPSPVKGHSADHFYRPNPTKYKHFDFADGSDPQDAPKPAPEREKSKHDSQWGFEDFNTPAKALPTKALRGEEVVHWGNEDDEVTMDSPIRQQKVDKPRRDAETHFDFVDDGTPEGTKRLVGRPRGGGGVNTGLGLYQNNLYDENGKAPATDESPKRVLGNIANIKDRSKDFDSQFTITDEMPMTKQVDEPAKLSGDRMKSVKMMDANWSAMDDYSPSAGNQKENAAPVASNSRPNTGTGKGPLSESTNTMSTRNDNPKGISIGGNGMGGKKGTGRSWGIGDDSDGEETGGLNATGGQFRKGLPGKKQGTGAQTGGGDFWDF